MPPRVHRLIFFFCILFLSGATSRAGPDPSPANGDAMIAGTIAEPSNLIPMLASDSASHAISGLIYKGLLKYDTDLRLIGDLAESWDVSEDGLTITFHLRSGVTWEDGTPFTADDVLFGFKTITDPNVPTAYSGDYLQFNKAEVLDSLTFQVSYDEPFSPALASWESTLLPTPSNPMAISHKPNCPSSSSKSKGRATI